jgi:hypothetical protein
MPRAFYPIEELIDKTDRLCIDSDLFEQVEDYKLEKEIERLEEKRERLMKLQNESLERVINKINSIKNYLNKNKI